MTTLLAAEVPSLTELLTGVRLVTSLSGMFLVAVIVGRLLGVRRGPAPIVGVGDRQAGSRAPPSRCCSPRTSSRARRFVRNLWLFSTFSTMSATVWIEMLAKPGTLAAGRRRA